VTGSGDPVVPPASRPGGTRTGFIITGPPAALDQLASVLATVDPGSNVRRAGLPGQPTERLVAQLDPAVERALAAELAPNVTFYPDEPLEVT
jgi:hypothetical protein